MTTIYVDADACPVKEETVAIAERHETPVKMVCNGGLRPIRNPLVEMVYVAEGPDVADDWIAEHIGAGDICVTADIPLADRCVKAGVVVIKPDGEIVENGNIGAMLATRNLMADLREQGTVTSHHSAFSQRDRSRFRQALESALRRASG